MNEVIKMDGERAADAVAISLAQWMGRREAFGLVAGRCSAADIEIIRRIRDERMYAIHNCTWDEFCVRHLRVSRRTVDREIAHLREFGPAFFTVRQLTHIRPDEYRKIAPHVTAEGVTVDGALVPLDPRYGEPLSAAVERLLEASDSPRAAAAAGSFDAILKRCRSAARAFDSFQGALDQDQMRELTRVVADLRNAAANLGARV